MRRVRTFVLAALSLVAVDAIQPLAAFEDRTPRVHALVGARVVTQPNEVFESATIVLRDGIIVDVGDVEPPADARIWDFEGKTIYAGLIESYLDLQSKKQRPGGGADSAARERKKETEAAGVRHPNPNVLAEKRIAESLKLATEKIEELRAAGFAAAHVVPGQGVFRGRTALVAMREGDPEQQIILVDVAHLVAFDHGSWRDRDNIQYPSSLMGATALIRQTLLDAAWAAESLTLYASRRGGLERPQSNLALDALATVFPETGHAPVWLLTTDVLASLRASALVSEFELNAVLVGNGEEYQYLDELRGAPYPLVLPVNFPKVPEFAGEDEALAVGLEELRHWDAAPSNPSRLRAAGIELALTSHGLKKRKDFRARVASAIERGLDEEEAIAAVTTVPARILGVEKQLGTIASGKIANLTITDGDLFAEKTRILEVWVDGERYEVRDKKADSVDDLRGLWMIVAGDAEDPARQWTLELKGNEWTLRATLADDRGAVPVRQVRWQHGELQVTIGSQEGESLRLRPSGKKKLQGTWEQANGTLTEIAAERPDSTPGGER